MRPVAGRRRIVVLVVGETARADHFSLYGYDRQTTPELENVADLLRFDDAEKQGTLDRIAAHVDTAIFKIANFPSRSLGVDLHPTLRPADWWVEQLASFWSVARLPLKTGREEYLFRCVPN
jgi:hypothetical protein